MQSQSNASKTSSHNPVAPPGEENRGAGWWPLLAGPLKLPADIQPNAPSGLLHPWVVALKGGAVASGPQNLPLFGAASFLLGLASTVWVLLSRSDLVDTHEGFLAGALADVRACEAIKWISTKKWIHALLSPGDVMYVPRGWTCLLLATISDDSIFPCAVHLPALRMDPWDWENDGQTFNHVVAGAALNACNMSWQDAQRFERMFQMPDTGSQTSDHSQLPLTAG